MSDFQFEEEEFSTQFSDDTIRRIFSLTWPYWRWIAGFVVAIGLVAIIESSFAYINKLIIDDSLRDKFTKEGQKRFRSHFATPKSIAKKLGAKFCF